MRIALTHLFCWPEVRRGAERYTHELASALLRAGQDVQIVSTAPRASSDMIAGVPVRRLRRHGELRRFLGEAAEGMQFGAQAALRLGLAKLDVWHAMSIGDGYAATLAGKVRPGLRSVYTEVGFPVKRSHDRRSDRRLYDFVVREVDQFICLSPPAGECLTRDYGRTGAVIGGGVNLRAFHPTGPAAVTRPVLLFPSAIDEPRKNLTLLLEAAALLLERSVDFEIWLVGPGNLPTRLSPRAERGLRAVAVHRVADSAELPQLYAKSSVTVLPSNSEVFGLVVLESFACGTPAVVLDDGLGPAGLITDQTGVRCAQTAESLADACEQAIDLSARRSTVEACHARAADYDWDTVIVPAMLALYEGQDHA